MRAGVGGTRAALLMRGRFRFAQTVRAGVGMTPAVGRVAGVVLALAAAMVLFFFDPASHGFYPPCLFKTIFGHPCPGCGSLRAAHQLLHGNLQAAWALNPTLMIAGPLAASAALLTFLRNRKTR